MELYDEEVEQKKSKIPMIIGISIAILVILTILVVVGILYLKNSIITIQIDGVRNTEIEKILYKEQTENGLELYIPVIDVAEFLGYEGYNGDYKNKSEDKSKCYVTNGEETAMFTLNSDMLIKVTSNSADEYIQLDKPVFEKDGELYTTIYGVEKAFNIAFGTDEKFKNIKIYTMDFLIQYYAIQFGMEEGYSDNFTDKKAIFENMMIIEQDQKYGVIDVEKKMYVLEPKYESISYFPTTIDFLVKSNGKYGVVEEDATEKLDTIYDEIKTIDNQKGLYLIKQNNAYGILNTEGKVIIEPEYKQIGINIDKYAQNGVENQYILLDEIIPIKNSQDLWGFFNIKGEKIVDFKYTGVGCQLTPVSNSYPAVVIPSYKVIVVANDKYYNLITSDGKELISGNILDSVYLKTDIATKQNKFFMTSNGNSKTLNVEEWLASIGE